jgi:hypothetical protein
MVDEMAVGQVFLQVLRVSPESTNPPMLHTYLHIARTGRTSGRSIEMLQKAALYNHPPSSLVVSHVLIPRNLSVLSSTNIV